MIFSDAAISFHRFRQAHSSTTCEYGGLGLGLAIARHLVELHGGVVLAHSDGEGKGAEFTVQLPVSAAFQSAQPGIGVRLLPSLGASTTGAMPSLDGLRILLVDDEPDAREMVAAILSEAGAVKLLLPVGRGRRSSWSRRGNPTR